MIFLQILHIDTTCISGKGTLPLLESFGNVGGTSRFPNITQKIRNAVIVEPCCRTICTQLECQPKTRQQLQPQISKSILWVCWYVFCLYNYLGWHSKGGQLALFVFFHLSPLFVVSGHGRESQRTAFG